MKLFALVLMLALAGCASPVVWVKPGATEAQFNMDRARCQLMAQGMNPDTGVEMIRTGKVRTDIAANTAVAILHDIAQGAKKGHTFSLCMQASGYIPTAPRGPPVAPAPGPSLATAPVAPVPLAPTLAALAPLRRVAVAPSPAPFIPCSEGDSCGGDQSITVNP